MRRRSSASRLTSAAANPLLALAMLISALGCESALSETDVEIALTVSRTVIPSGDSLRIRIFARNPTDRVIELVPGPCGPLSYRIFDLDGTRIAPSPDQFCGFIGGSPKTVLQPGDSTSSSHLWSAIRNYGEPGRPDSLPPGRYPVIGGLHGEPDLRFPTDTVFVEVITP